MHPIELIQKLESKPTPSQVEEAKAWLLTNSGHDLADCILRLLAQSVPKGEFVNWVEQWVQDNASRRKLTLSLRYCSSPLVRQKALSMVDSRLNHWDVGEILYLLLLEEKSSEIVHLSFEWLKLWEVEDFRGQLFRLLLKDSDTEFGTVVALDKYSEEEDSNGLLSAFVKHAPSEAVLRSSLKYIGRYAGSAESGFLLSKLIGQGLLKEPDEYIEHWLKAGGNPILLVEIVSQYYDQIGPTEYLKKLCRRFMGKRVPNHLWALQYGLLMDDDRAIRDWLMRWLPENLSHKKADSTLVALVENCDHEVDDELLALVLERFSQSEPGEIPYLLEVLLEAGVKDPAVLKRCREELEKRESILLLMPYALQYYEEEYLPIAKELVLRGREKAYIRGCTALQYLRVSDDPEIVSALEEILKYAFLCEPKERARNWWYFEYEYVCYLLDKSASKENFKRANDWLTEFGPLDSHYSMRMKEKLSDLGFQSA